MVNTPIRSCYRRIMSRFWGQRDKVWSLVWDWPEIERVKMFLWLVAHDKLHTSMLRHQRWGANPNCVVCRELETTLHVLRDCKIAFEIWSMLVPAVNKRAFFNMNLVEWLCSELERREVLIGDVQWNVVFGTACWFIWKMRNSRMFETNARVKGAVEMQRTILRFSLNMMKALNTGKVEMSGQRRVLVKWQPPDKGWLKFNSDGASKGNPGWAGCGGVVRDSEGRWVLGFGRNIGICSALQAELWGVLVGLEQCWNAGFRKVEVELDSVTAISQVVDDGERVEDDGSLLQMIRSWGKEGLAAEIFSCAERGKQSG